MQIQNVTLLCGIVGKGNFVVMGQNYTLERLTVII